MNRCMFTPLVMVYFTLHVIAPECVGADDKPARKPNIVFIMADDFGWRDPGFAGSTFHQTPNLDKLAKRGVRMTQAYAAYPLCSPTRSSVLTGLWPARTGITAPTCHLPQVILEKGLAAGNPKTRVLAAQSLTRLKTDYVTLPKLLREAGYRTGHFGKWHLGAEPYSAKEHGFDVDFPHWPGPGPAGSYVAPWKFPPALNITAEAGEHIEDRTASAAAQFIRDNKDRPFYLNYWLFSVHAPYDAKSELVAKYRKLMDPNNPQRNPVYAAMVESLDDGVGRVLTALEESGLIDNTIIVFFSDNGGISWEGKGDGKHKSARFQEDMQSPPTSNLPLRNGKASLYEGGVREPCVISWPGVTQPGSVNDTLLQSIDWMPTLLDMVGVPLPPELKLDGISLVPTLKGGSVARDTLYWHFPHDTPASGQHPATSVRRGNWKLIRQYAGNVDGSDLLELYDLATDLGETKNVAQLQPALVAELNALIDQFLVQTQAVVPKLNPNYQANAASVSTDNKAITSNKNERREELQGWVERGCVADRRDGALVVTGRSTTPFLGVTAGTKGKAIVTLRARAAAGGMGKVEWVPGGQATNRQDLPSVAFSLEPDRWNDLQVELPDASSISILRLYLPAQSQPVTIDWVQLKSQEKTLRWDF